MNTTFFRIFLLLLFCSSLNNQYIEANSRNYQVEDGLSYNSVWSLCQDDMGFLWVGTKDGLNRFDGHTFKIYQRRTGQNTLGSSFIHTIGKLRDDRLLIGTANGLYLYRRQHDDFTPVILLRNTNKQPTINHVAEDNNGNIWIATHGKGLFCLDNNLNLKKHYQHQEGKQGALPSDYIWSLCIDQHNNLWMGTAGVGLAMLNAHTRTFNSIKQWKGTDINGQAIYSVWSDEDGTLWMGTASAGLLHYNPSTNHVEKLLTNIANIKSIHKGTAGKLIMGSEKGVIELDRRTSQWSLLTAGENDMDEKFNAVFAIEPDKNGGFWVGTYFAGLNYLKSKDNSVRKVFPTGNPLSRMAVSSVAELDNGKVLVATHNSNHIYNYDATTGEITQGLKIDGENVQDMCANRGQLYIGLAGQGIDCYTLPEMTKKEHLRYNIAEDNALFTLTDGSLMLAQEGGGVVYIPISGKAIELEPLEHVLINGVAQDSRGNIWFSTYSNGLYIWTHDRHWQNIQQVTTGSETLSLFNLSCMTLLGENLWLGSKEQGLIVMNTHQKKVVRTIDAQNGLFSNSVYSMVCDKRGCVWASTKDNIVCINPEDWTVRFIGHQDRSTPSNIHKAFCSSDGSLYFGGTKGFYHIRPNLFPKETHQSTMCFTQFCNEIKELTLDYDQNTISLDFALLDFTAPEENIYRYKMDGLDDDWIYTKTPVANYMNLLEGTYILKVSGSNGNGAWVDAPQLTITVNPPLWRSFPMLILYVALCVLVVTFCVLRYNRYLFNKQKERQHEFERAHEREVYEQKIGFFTNIAHEIRTPLTLISGPLENIVRNHEVPIEARHHMETIQRNTTRLLALVSQLLDFRKIENDMFQLNIRYHKVQAIIMKVCEQYMPEAESNGIKLSVNMPDYEVLAYIDAEALYKIISNLLSNALKFTRTKVDINLNINNNIGTISVIDDGKGISSESQKDIFEPFSQIKDSSMENRGTGLGLSLSKSLTLKMNGTLTYDKEFLGGARFVLELPMMADNKAPALHNNKKNNTSSATPIDNRSCVLVVEDNPDLLKFMQETLSENFKVVTAANGQIALDFIVSQDVDIIVSDVMMPVMDGLELCERLKDSPDYGHLPIILLSAKTDVDTKVKGLRWGADVYLDKPFSVEQLMMQIESILQKRERLHKRIIESPLDSYPKEDRNDKSAAFVKRLNEIILEKMSDRDFNVEILVKEFATNRSDFQKKVKKITGMTPNDYIRLVRLKKSVQLLAKGEYKINEVCAIVGFNSPSYFSKCFYEQYGKLPKDYMNTIK